MSSTPMQRRHDIRSSSAGSVGACQMAILAAAVTLRSPDQDLVNAKRNGDT
jgi:hypothetical protein